MDPGRPSAASSGSSSTGRLGGESRWQPWWFVGDRTRVRRNLTTAAMSTLLVAVTLGLGRSSWVVTLNWALLAGLSWILGLSGLALSKQRPDLGVRPRRPSTTPATLCVLGAALAAAGAVLVMELLMPDRAALGLAWFAGGVAICAGLGITAHRLNDRAEASGRFARAVSDPGQPT